MINVWEFWAGIITFFVLFCFYYHFAGRSKNKAVKWSLRLWPVWTVIFLFIWIDATNPPPLIRASPYRALITQLETVNAAVNTFRTRYKGLPGDHASITHYFSAEHYPDIRDGDGNKLLAGEESVQFWRQLEAAELVRLKPLGEGIVQANFHDNNLINKWFSEPAGIVVYASGEKNYYQIARYKTEDVLKILPAFTPEETFNLDSKIDDGRPFTGSVTIRSAAHDGSSRLDGDITQVEVGYKAGNAYACINESDISTDAKKRAATYAFDNKNLACSIRIRMN